MTPLFSYLAMRWLTSATERFSILAMFSRDSVALACKILNSSSIIHLKMRIAVENSGFRRLGRAECKSGEKSGLDPDGAEGHGARLVQKSSCQNGSSLKSPWTIGLSGNMSRGPTANALMRTRLATFVGMRAVVETALSHLPSVRSGTVRGVDRKLSIHSNKLPR